MKNLKATSLLVLFISIFISKVNAQEKHVDASAWAELKQFHEVMAQTFHPAEEGNFAPIRERSGELHDKAVALEKSTPPADFKNDAIAAAVKELAVKTKDVDSLVKRKVKDEEIMKALSAAHNSFHKIVGLCSKGEHEEHKE